jgi:peptidoglycan/LPS O-acetylase OafA/YrhL
MCAMTVVVIFLWDRWDFGVYIMGGIVGQIDAIMTENAKEKEMSLSVNPIQSTPTEKPSIDDTPSRIWAAARAVGARITKLFGRHKYLSNNVLHTLGLLIAFYFLSFPDWDYERSNGYVFLTKLIPSWITYRTKFYPMIGTALFIFLLARSDPQHSRWRKLLNSSLAQYLGTISFAVYLVHGPILHAIGYMIPQYMWWFLGTEGSEPGMLPWLLVLLVGWVLSLLLVIMVADIWSREVDGRCAKLVKKLEEICFQKA